MQTSVRIIIFPFLGNARAIVVYQRIVNDERTNQIRRFAIHHEVSICCCCCCCCCLIISLNQRCSEFDELSKEDAMKNNELVSGALFYYPKLEI